MAGSLISSTNQEGNSVASLKGAANGLAELDAAGLLKQQTGDWVNVKKTPYNATGNGSTDDTSAIHAARTAAGTNGTLYFPAGTYKVANLALNVAGQTWILSAGATLRCSTSTTECARITANDVTLTGGTVDCTGATLTNSVFGVDIAGFTARGVTFKNLPHPLDLRRCSSRLRIQDCRFLDCADGGIYINNNGGSSAPASDYLITGNFIRNMTDQTAAIFIWTDGADAAEVTNRFENVVISNNTINGATGSDTSAAGIICKNLLNFQVTGNVVNGGFMNVSVSNSRNGSITGNSLSNPYYCALETSISHDVTISGNQLDGQANAGGAIAFLCSNIGSQTFTGNEVRGFTGAFAWQHIDTSGGDSGTKAIQMSIVGNKVYNDENVTNWSAVYAQGTTTSMVVAGNHFEAGTNAGRVLFCSKAANNVTVVGNTFLDFTTAIVWLFASSGSNDYITVKANNLHNCGPAVLNGLSGSATLGKHIGTSHEYDGTAAPSTGTWRVSDRVWNSAPATSDPMGWLCTASGTPGTWEAMPAPDGTTTAIAVTLGIAVSDETTTITTGAGKVRFRMPHAMTLTGVRASLTTASSSGVVTVDINEGGSTILSTKLNIDASEKTSTTAATAAVISDTALADDAEITFDIDAAGTGAAGLKVWLIGTRT